MGGKIEDDTSNGETAGSPYMRAPKKFNLWRGIYNKDKNYILGRTPQNWGLLLVFYTIFYIVLAALFAICMQGLFATLSDNEPKWQLDSSRIGSNPGLGFRPISDNLNHGSLIWYKANDTKQVKHWVQLLDDFLEPYINATKSRSPNSKACDFNSAPGQRQVCGVDITHFGPCSPEHGYSLNKSAPCFFLKLNRIYNWAPEYYDDINALPEEMPIDLKEYIKTLPGPNRKQVWISCEGENASDNEVIGPMKYYPTRGFPSYFYPFQNQQNYLSPLIAINFERPGLNRIINIECRAWAKNILYNGSYRDRQGSVHFELMVD